MSAISDVGARAIHPVAVDGATQGIFVVDIEAASGNANVEPRHGGSARVVGVMNAQGMSHFMSQRRFEVEGSAAVDTPVDILAHGDVRFDDHLPCL